MNAYKWVSEHIIFVSCDYPLIIIKSKAMVWKLVLAAITVLVQQDVVSAEFTTIPSTTTAAELWNPYTWFWPYAIASAESYRDYFLKAQKATNELYQQIYATNANPLITGNWGGASPAKKPEANNSGGKPSDSNQDKNEAEAPAGSSNQTTTDTNSTPTNSTDTQASK